MAPTRPHIDVPPEKFVYEKTFHSIEKSMLLHIRSVLYEYADISTFIPRLIDRGGVTNGCVLTRTEPNDSTNRSIVIRVVFLEVSPIENLIVRTVNNIATRIV